MFSIYCIVERAGAVYFRTWFFFNLGTEIFFYNKYIFEIIKHLTVYNYITHIIMEKLQNKEEGEIKMEDGEIPVEKMRQLESLKEEGGIIENENKGLQLNLKFLKCIFCIFVQPISDTESKFAQTVLCPFARFRRHITKENMLCFICEEHFDYSFDLEDHIYTIHQVNEGYITCNIN